MQFCRDDYDLAEIKLKAFTRSATRTKIMLCLLKGTLSTSDMEAELGSRDTTILHAIREMAEENLVTKSLQGYALTNIGRIQAHLLERLVGTIAALNQHPHFWLDHDISGIPLELQKTIGMLIQSEIVTSDSSAPLRVHENFLAELSRAREIHGVSPVIYPGYSDAIAKAVKSDVHVELILTDKIMEILAKDYVELGRELLKHDNFRLYIINADVREAFTVTDTLLSLGLFRLNGDYDVSNDLICKGDWARMWGMKLFRYYLNLSKRMQSI